MLLPWFGYLGEISSEANSAATRSFGTNWAIIFIVGRAARNLHGSTSKTAAEVMRMVFGTHSFFLIVAVRPTEGLPYTAGWVASVGRTRSRRCR